MYKYRKFYSKKEKDTIPLCTVNVPYELKSKAKRKIRSELQENFWGRHLIIPLSSIDWLQIKFVKKFPSTTMF